MLLQARIGSCLESEAPRPGNSVPAANRGRKNSDLINCYTSSLPRDIAAELKATDAVKPRRFEKVGILFCDIVEFTAYSARRGPEEILSHLQTLVEAFEQLCLKHDLEKIKTIGDSFMATAGLVTRSGQSSALNCVRCGLSMVAAARELPPRVASARWHSCRARSPASWGTENINTMSRGDAVNTASRMEQAAAAGSSVR